MNTHALTDEDKAIKASIPFVLTPREYQTLKLLVRGYSNDQIGTELGIGTGTVKIFTKQLFRLTGASAREELYPFAGYFGLKPHESPVQYRKKLKQLLDAYDPAIDMPDQEALQLLTEIATLAKRVLCT